MGKPKRQLNLGNLKGHAPSFSAWCDENNYVPAKAVLTGWLLLARLSHDERVELFRELDHLLEEEVIGDVSTPPPKNGKSGKELTDGGSAKGERRQSRAS